MESNKLELFSLYQLHRNAVLTKGAVNQKVKYFIDSYQRGYRWGPKQIKLLLDDLWEFHQKKKSKSLKDKEYYCLQPIVVKLIEIDSVFYWEVIDGQQRLTSLKILISYLTNQVSFNLWDEYSITDFEILYKTRKESQAFLTGIHDNFKSAEKNDNIDFYYMSMAYETIEKWFDEKNISQNREKREFLDQLLSSNDQDNPIKVIWYEVNDDSDSYDIFTRLNIGKIKLTNSELIKALFLKNADSTELEDRLILNEIANDWNILENKLQDDEFWYFIFNPNNKTKYPNRLEYVFDLYVNKAKGSEEYYTFFSMNESLSDKASAKQRLKVWQSFKAYFLNLEGWFIDIEFYHYIGFLIAVGTEISDIIGISKDKDKDVFLRALKERIKNRIDLTSDELRDLKYGNKKIFSVLLLFNIVTIDSNENSNYRFPFHLFKNQKWDIEHIRSQNDKNISKDEDWKSWIRDIVEYFTNKNIEKEMEYSTEPNWEDRFQIDKSGEDKIKQELKELIDLYKDNNFSKSVLDLSFQFFREHFNEDKDDLEKDSINNLALLDASTNRSYGNAFFIIKRKRIQENGKYGLFTPLCTTNAFMKVYSKKLNQLNHWSVEDGENYVEEILTLLKPYLKD